MNKKAMIAIFIILVLSLSGNVFLFQKLQNKQITQADYKYLSVAMKNIPVDSNIENEGKAILHYKPLKEAIISKLNLAGDEKFGIYLQDVQTGAWLGINESESFIPASLLKLPIAMAIMKKIENGAMDLKQKIAVLDADIDAMAGTPDALKINDEKTVAEILGLMIKDSNNTAKNILKRQLSEEEINEVFTHVGIDNPYNAENESSVNPRQFSRLFKALYFSTYLKPQSSEKLLELAMDTKVESLIAAGVPWEIQVAHKYGERYGLLHDCGIVYHPKNPYILCIMTDKIELAKARALISGISREIYDYVSNN